MSEHVFWCRKCGETSTRFAGYRLMTNLVPLVRARDGDDCWICKLPVWFDAPEFFHHAAASIDHVKPTSKGGCSCLHNLRLAHHWCNRMRSNDPPETKLRLRGCAGHMRKVLKSVPQFATMFASDAVTSGRLVGPP